MRSKGVEHRGRMEFPKGAEEGKRNSNAIFI